MINMENKKLIAIVGMPGSGKSLVSKAAINLNLPVYSCGDIIREEAIKKGLSLTHENLSKIMIEIRERNGAAAVVKKLIPKIMMDNKEVAVVEGVRSRAEVEELKKHFKNVKILAKLSIKVNLGIIKKLLVILLFLLPLHIKVFF